MHVVENTPAPVKQQLPKASTGIQGFDEITQGGLPRGRTALICGGPGCGKTLFGMEFLVRGILQYDEPGVFVSFEENADDLAQNVASLGYDLNELCHQQKLVLDHVHIERNEIEETGEYDLEGLFIRLNYAIDQVGAKRVVLDTLEALFAGLPNEAILRAELRRLFSWLKKKGVTAVITAERGTGVLTRHGLEEYVSDCVILLDHRVDEQISTRRLRIVKYRGSAHGANEYPFLIDEGGFSVFPVTSLELNHRAATERISTGVPRLDTMLDGEGFHRGSSILVSGTAGTGKSSIAAQFSSAACARGERVLYFAFEESPSQIMRNMRSIGLDLESWVRAGLLRFHAVRPTLHGLEMHLAITLKLVQEFQPQAIIIDPISNLIAAGTQNQARIMLTRMIDYFKNRGITALFTSLTEKADFLEHTDIGVSSLMDTWLGLRTIESGGERNRGLYILKSRGTAHSNQIREFRLTDHGIDLVDVYLGPEGVLTGTARYQQEAKEREAARIRTEEIKTKQRNVERRRLALEAQIAQMRAEIEAEEDALAQAVAQEKRAVASREKNRAAMARMRHAEEP
ncbi:circadian clock protein KaiC [Nitrosococcus wardiae]|uniref:non-specific serine/threonine protein kinase n=1 Tax=Nitrosococcus wardiae TaxID=1814290 RepID=A0A4V1AW17_9GAMM|nr:circadian clock protein KaiC [Nitrosococcus wardiae]QBQ55075.1 circadian clock protein KaiC [Nitrosococcus wardiae]